MYDFYMIGYEAAQVYHEKLVTYGSSDEGREYYISYLTESHENVSLLKDGWMEYEKTHNVIKYMVKNRANS